MDLDSDDFARFGRGECPPGSRLEARTLTEVLHKSHTLFCLLKPGAPEPTSANAPPSLLRAAVRIRVTPAAGPAGSFSVAAACENTGGSTWVSAFQPTGGQVTFGVKILRADGRLVDDLQGRRVLPRDVRPGETVEVESAVALAGLPSGRYRLVFDMVAERVAWFGDLGSPTAEHEVESPWPAPQGTPPLDITRSRDYTAPLMRTSRNNEVVERVDPGPAAARLKAFLRARGLRMTGERDALLRAALGRRRHFTLEELVEEAVEHDARASRATVYRGLPILIEAGILQPVLVSDEPRRFELALGRRHHDHLLCRLCGRVVEFRSSVIEELQLRVAARHGFRLTSHVHELVGDCAACRRAGRKPKGARPRRRA